MYAYRTVGVCRWSKEQQITYGNYCMKSQLAVLLKANIIITYLQINLCTILRVRPNLKNFWKYQDEDDFQWVLYKLQWAIFQFDRTGHHSGRTALTNRTMTWRWRSRSGGSQVEVTRATAVDFWVLSSLFMIIGVNSSFSRTAAGSWSLSTNLKPRHQC